MPIDLNKVKLTLSASQNKTIDSLTFTVTLENNTGTDFFVLNRQTVNLSNNPVIAWHLRILFGDSITVISPVHFFPNPQKPKNKDYFNLENGDKYVFNFIVDFNKLARIPLEFGNLNKDYGVYSLQLAYKDPFCVVKDALTEQIQSNTIKITYKK